MKGFCPMRASLSLMVLLAETLAFMVGMYPFYPRKTRMNSGLTGIGMRPR